MGIQVGVFIQATMSLQHCLKQIEFSKTETSCQVVRTANMRYKYSASKYHLSPRCPHDKPIKPSIIIQGPKHRVSIVCLQLVRG